MSKGETMNEGHFRILLMLLGALASFFSFAFTTFETKEQIRNNIMLRLDRIENKLDRLIEREAK
jgi:hypothetical protein